MSVGEHPRQHRQIDRSSEQQIMRLRQRAAELTLVKAGHAKTLPAAMPDGSVHRDGSEQDRLAAHRKSVSQRDDDQRDQQQIDLALTPEPPPYDRIVGRSEMELREKQVQ